MRQYYFNVMRLNLYLKKRILIFDKIILVLLLQFEIPQQSFILPIKSRMIVEEN